MTSQTQAIVWHGDYDPFGNATLVTNTVSNNIRFPGQYFDQESGLHYNYFRDYNPNDGRYMQSDPIGLNGGLNTYSYALQNPATYIDPNGLAVLNPVSGATGGAFICGPVCAAVGGVAGGLVTYFTGKAVVNAMNESGDEDSNVIPFPGTKECDTGDGDPCEQWLDELLALVLGVKLGMSPADELEKRALNNAIKKFKESCPHLKNEINFI